MLILKLLYDFHLASFFRCQWYGVFVSCWQRFGLCIGNGWFDRSYVWSMSDPVPLNGPRRTLNHDRVNSLQVAPQLSTVESIHICITSEIILHPCLLALFPYSRSWESFRMLSLHYIVIHFVLLLNGLCCCIVVFIHGTGFCFPCIHSFSSNDGCLSGTFVCRSVIAGSTSRPSWYYFVLPLDPIDNLERRGCGLLYRYIVAHLLVTGYREKLAQSATSLRPCGGSVHSRDIPYRHSERR